jgi:hypothetical protein
MSSPEKYIALLMASRDQAHVYHFVTKSFAQHKALQQYYEDIVPLFDAWAEGYMGKYRKLKDVHIPSHINHNPTRAVAYFKSLIAKIRRLRLPKDTYLKNIQDEIMVLIQSTIYMLSLK